MQVAAFLHLIRWKNLLLILYTQLIIKFLFFESFSVHESLSIFHFILFLSSLLSITAAGYVINDCFDIETDLLNKPKKVVIGKRISLELGKKIYYLLNTVGIVLGILLAVIIQKYWVAIVFISVALLLYMYSKYLKAVPLIGNFLIALLIAFTLVFLPILDVSSSGNVDNNNLVFSIVYIISFFAFSLNFIRELIKDIEDINGDYSLNMNTLPILLGRNRTRDLALILVLFPTLFIIAIMIYLSPENKLITLYLLFFIILPLLFIIQKLAKTKSKKGFHKISTYLKICMFFGINTIIIISLFYN